MCRSKNTFGYPLVKAKLQEWVVAQESEFTLSVQCVKGAKIPALIELDIRRRKRNDGALWLAEYVESRSQCRRGIVQVAGIDVMPPASFQAINESLNRGN